MCSSTTGLPVDPSLLPEGGSASTFALHFGFPVRTVTSSRRCKQRNRPGGRRAPSHSCEVAREDQEMGVCGPGHPTTWSLFQVRGIPPPAAGPGSIGPICWASPEEKKAYLRSLLLDWSIYRIVYGPVLRCSHYEGGNCGAVDTLPPDQ